MSAISLQLEFQGHWTIGTIGLIPDASGVYCVYECRSSGGENPEMQRLLYIGEAENAREDVVRQDDLDLWRQSIADENQLCFTFAPVASDVRKRAYAALLFEFSPPLNKPLIHIQGIGRPATDEVRFFPFDKTVLKISGMAMLLKSRVVAENEGPAGS